MAEEEPVWCRNKPWQCGNKAGQPTELGPDGNILQVGSAATTTATTTAVPEATAAEVETENGEKTGIRNNSAANAVFRLG